MRIFLDTNILVSAILNNLGHPYKAYKKAVNPPNKAFICDQNLEELRRVFKLKFPDKIPALEKFISTAISEIKVIPVPPSHHSSEDKIRDIDDRPILRAAIKAKVEIIITGDKDFLESKVTTPKIITAAQFIQE